MRSRRWSSETRLLRAARVACALHALYILVCVSQPLYLLSGVAEGAVAISWYSLEYYGEPARIPSLDAAGLLAIPLVVLAVYEAASSALGSLAGPRGEVELLLGGALAALAEAPLLAGLPVVLAVEVRGISRNNVFETSAGLADFGRTRVEETWVLRNLLNPMVPIALSAFLLAIAIAAWNRTHGLTLRELAERLGVSGLAIASAGGRVDSYGIGELEALRLASLGYRAGLAGFDSLVARRDGREAFVVQLESGVWGIAVGEELPELEDIGSALGEYWRIAGRARLSSRRGPSAKRGERVSARSSRSRWAAGDRLA